MNVARWILSLLFCTVFVASYFTNKYVLSILNFTYPTIFQGWQTSIGTLLLLFIWKLGLVEISGFSRSATVAHLPVSIIFIGNIYAGSKALSLLPIPFFFVLQNASEVFVIFIVRVTQREKPSWMKLLSVCLQLGSTTCLIVHNPRFGPGGYTWSSLHLLCVGAYKVLHKNSKTNHLSGLAEHFANYLISTLLLATLAHSTGDLSAALDFPLLSSHRFLAACSGSAVLSFILMLTSVRLKDSVSSEHCGVCFLLAKVLASGISLSFPAFRTAISSVSLCCITLNFAGEALLVYLDRSN